jgi:hypothetical protein
MSYTELPGFMGDLQARHANATLALEFAILTAARSGEVLGARWDAVLMLIFMPRLRQHLCSSRRLFVR